MRAGEANGEVFALPPLPTLRTERLVLRPLVDADIASIVRVNGSFEVVKNTLTMPHPYHEADAVSFLGRVRDGHAKGEGLCLAIVRVDDRGAEGEEFVGTMGLRVTPAHRYAEAGYALGTAYWGRGYATEALREFLRYGFEVLNLRRIEARFHVSNPASGRVMEKCGFVREGVLRQCTLRFGVWHDVVVMAILQEEWEASRARGDRGGGVGTVPR